MRDTHGIPLAEFVFRNSSSGIRLRGIRLAKLVLLNSSSRNSSYEARLLSSSSRNSMKPAPGLPAGVSITRIKPLPCCCLSCEHQVDEINSLLMYQWKTADVSMENIATMNAVLSVSADVSIASIISAVPFKGYGVLDSLRTLQTSQWPSVALSCQGGPGIFSLGVIDVASLIISKSSTTIGVYMLFSSFPFCFGMDV